MRYRTIAAAIGLAAMLAATTADAAISTDVNGMAGWKGVVYFHDTLQPELAVDVEFCVYAPGDFAKSYPGEDPSNGLHYVYAYMVDNNLADHPYLDETERDYVNRFSVGLDVGEDEQGANRSYVDGAGVNPHSFGTLDDSTVKWNFLSPTLEYGQVSDVLYFTSPFGPEWDDSTVAGANASVTLLSQMPSPTPEPATLGLLAVAGLAVVRRRRNRA